MKTHLVIPDAIRKKKQSNGVCIVCEENPIEENRNSYCRACRLSEDRKRWLRTSREKRVEKWLKTNYKLSFEDYIKIYNQQDGLCKTCSIEIYWDKASNEHQKACVDHCHSTGKIRGLLCNHCNRALGLVKDSTSTLEKMVSYLNGNA